MHAQHLTVAVYHAALGQLSLLAPTEEAQPVAIVRRFPLPTKQDPSWGEHPGAVVYWDAQGS